MNQDFVEFVRQLADRVNYPLNLIISLNQQDILNLNINEDYLIKEENGVLNVDFQNHSFIKLSDYIFNMFDNNAPNIPPEQELYFPVQRQITQKEFNEAYKEEYLVFISREPSDLDNEVTTQIKVAALEAQVSKYLMLLRPEDLINWNLPNDYIIKYPSEENPKYYFISISDFVGIRLHYEDTLLDIRSKILSRNPDIELNEIIFISLNHLVPPENTRKIKRNPNEYGNPNNYYYEFNIPQKVLTDIIAFYEVFNMNLSNPEALIQYFNTWILEQVAMMKQDRIKLENIIKNQRILSEIPTTIPNSKISTFFFKEIEYFYKPKYNNNKISIVNATDFFNLMKATMYVPFLQYVGLNDNYFRIYSGNVENKSVNYDDIIMKKSKKKMNHIYFTLWSPRPDAERFSKESYRQGSYNLETGVLNIKLIIKSDDPTEIRKEMEKHLKECFPENHELGSFEEKNINGEFNILGSEFDQITLSDFLMTQPIFRDYFFINEQKKAVEEKVRFVINFFSMIDAKMKDDKRRSIYSENPQSPSSVEAGLVFMKTESNQSFSFLDTGELIYEPGKNKKLNGIATVNEKLTGNNVPVDLSYIQIKIYKSYSTNILNQFSTFLQKMLNVYLNGFINNPRLTFTTRRQLQDEYWKLIPYHFSQGSSVNIEHLLTKYQNQKKISKKRLEYRKLSALIREIPELFERKYSDLCQGIQKPTVVQHEDRNKYLGVPIYEEDKNGQMIATEHVHKLIEYPYPNPKFYLTCDDPNFPHIGLKENNKGDPDIMEKYPYVPCCFKTNRLGKNDPKIVQYYKADRLGDGNMLPENPNLLSDIQGKIRDTIKTAKKIIKFGEFSIVTPEIESILKISKEYPQFVRRGTIRSPNSLIHALMNVAEDDFDWRQRKSTLNYHGKILFDTQGKLINNPQTEDLEISLNPQLYYSGNITVREQYVIYLRHVLLKQENYINLVSQEMYDMTDAEKYSKITDMNTFFDSKLYYRALEEFFGVNIFVMTEDYENIIQIPRNKLFHIRVANMDRKSVVVFSHLGRGVTSETYPQYENIVGITLDDSGQKVRRHFFKFISTTKILYELLYKLDKVFKFKIENVMINSSEHREIKFSGNPYSNYNYKKFISTSINIKAQSIDSYGKVRSLLLAINDKDGTIKHTSMITLPTQPFNLPLYRGEPFRLSLSKTIEHAGDDFYSVDRKDGEIIGLWYSATEIPEFLYFPVIPEVNDNFNKYKTGTRVGLLSTKRNNEIEMSKLLHQTNLRILRILIWMYSIYNSFTGDDQSIAEKNIEDFIVKYIDYTSWKNVQGKIDVLALYDFSTLEPKLPNFKNVREAMAYLTNKLKFVQNGKFLMYSEKYASGIVYFLRQYNKQTIGLNLGSMFSDIRGYLRGEEDFIVYPDNLIFLRIEDLEKWQQSITLHRKNMRIFDVFEIELEIKEEPFKFYIEKTDRTYVVQNVQNGADGLYRAVSVAAKWYKEKINYGYHSKITINQTKLPYHIIYGVNSDKKLDVIESNAVDGEPYLEILRYNVKIDPKDKTNKLTFQQQQYAALLPIM